MLNLAFYKFVTLENLLPLRTQMREWCQSRPMRGTILISQEGINGCVAGPVELMREFQNWLADLGHFGEIDYKESISNDLTFKRMLVKIKKEIIPLGPIGPAGETIDPNRGTGKRLSAEELKQWLDEGREITLLDTRNDYEVAHGTFRGARRLPLQNFRAFPQELARIRPELEDKPVVMFCTGGIRCEKATSYALLNGLKDVYQLEGGILRYFEKCAGAHYEGNCFVFDERTAVTPELGETGIPPSRRNEFIS